MHRSIVHSCDTYYYVLANDMGVDGMYAELSKYGFGVLTGIDVQGESRGLLPSTEWKRRAYRKPEQQKWYAGETISLGIGQGYNNFTMLQLAWATATLANDGVKMKPHLLKHVVDVATKSHVAKSEPSVVGERVAKAENIAFIKQAMAAVNIEGTSARSFVGAPYTSGGKTGTAQVIAIKTNEKYDASKVAERHRDHALFHAFAPLENPRIALALIVENSGFGAQNAAPIARRVFDYWIAGLYPSEEDIAAVQKAQATAPIGKQRLAAEVPLMAVTQ
jgi:penicillin-binding protein 2